MGDCYYHGEFSTGMSWNNRCPRCDTCEHMPEWIRERNNEHYCTVCRAILDQGFRQGVRDLRGLDGWGLKGSKRSESKQR